MQRKRHNSSPWQETNNFLSLIFYSAHLFYDIMGISKKKNAGPVFLRFLNIQSRFNVDNYFLLGYSDKKVLPINELLPIILEKFISLQREGKAKKYRYI